MFTLTLVRSFICRNFVNSLATSIILLGAQPSLAQLISAQCQAKSTLKLQFTGVEQVQGNLCLAIFTEEARAAFPENDSAALISKCIPVNQQNTQQGVTTLQFPNVCEGRLAVSAFHDKNGNSKMDFKLLLPTEPFGFSRNPEVILEAPTWEDASFEFKHNLTLPPISLQGFF